MTTKSELLKAFAKEVKAYNFWDAGDWFFERGFNCHKLDEYVHSADSGGYEERIIWLVESFRGADVFLHFHFAVVIYGGNRSANPPELYEATPYVTTRYTTVLDNYVNGVKDD